MKVKIAVPDTPLFEPLYENLLSVKEEHEIELVKISENAAADLFIANRVDLALLTPIGYGKAKFKTGCYAIPGPGLTVEGFSGLASIFFQKNLVTIESAASPAPDDFMMIVGKKMLSERYGIEAELVKAKGDPGDLLKTNQAAIVYGMHAYEDPALDVTEEWHLSFDQPLPLCFWTTREEDYTPEIQNIIEALAAKDIMEAPVEFVSGDDDRTGRIIWRFNKEFEDAADNLLEFLYFHQFFPEAPSINFIGDESDTDDSL